MLAQLAVIPIGTQNASLSGHVAKVVELVIDSGLEYRLGPMGTTIEGDWDAVMGLLRRCHEILLQDCDRVITTMTLDDRKDQPGHGRLQQKIDSLQAKLSSATTP